MLEISESHYVARGRNRTCYRHPFDRSKCIKIDDRPVGGPTLKEAAYYEKLARLRPQLSYSHIPRFHGFVATSRGPGGVFDLIRDEGTDRVSLTVAQYLQAGAVSADDPRWQQAHRDYLAELFADAIMIRDFNPHNLCARRMLDGGIRLVSIDGIGHRDFLPLCDFFRAIARRKLARHLQRKRMDSLAAMLDRALAKQRPAESRKTVRRVGEVLHRLLPG